jgi:hypothetical protein
MPDGRTSPVWSGIFLFLLVVLSLTGLLIVLVFLHSRGQKHSTPRANSAFLGSAYLGDCDLPEIDSRGALTPAVSQQRRIG